MANTGKNKSALLSVSIIIMILLVVIAVAGVVVNITRDKQSDNYKVSVNNSEITDGSSVGCLSEDTEIEIDGLINCDVSVYCFYSGKDFSLSVDDDLYYWSEFDGLNVTKSFKFTPSAVGFILEYESFSDIVSKAQNGAAVSLSETPEGDTFRLILSTGENSFAFTFSVSLEVSGISLDHTNIVL